MVTPIKPSKFMDEDQNGEIDALEQSEATSEPNQEETTENDDNLQAELEKANELARNQKIRAEKAEKELKKLVKESPVQKSVNQGELSSTDLIAVINAKVSEDDLGEVKDYAKLKNISVSEALKTGFIKSLLADKEEQRQVAQATNVSNNRRGSTKMSEENLEAEALKGNMPDNEDDLRRLLTYRLKR